MPEKDAGSGPSAPALAAWHAAALALLGLTALVGAALSTLDGYAQVGLLGLTLPGLGGLLLLRRDGPDLRFLLLAGWSLAALAASTLTGGLAGPLSGLILMPLAVGLSLGLGRAPLFGALAFGAAALAGGLAGWLGVAQHPPAALVVLAALTGLGAAGLIGWSLRLSWVGRERRLYEALSERGRLEALLAAQPGLTLVLERNGRALAAYGAAPGSLPVDPLFDKGLIAAMMATDRPGVLAAFDRALAGRPDAVASFSPHQAPERRLSMIVRRLKPTVGNDTASPTSSPTSSPRLIATLFDSTRQHDLEIQLETARAAAEAESAGKTLFLANMSHELRTPLNAVIGFADIMRQRIFGPLSDRYAEYADNIHRAGGHLLDLINDVLDVSKIEADRYTLNKERFDARDALSSALAMLRVQADEKGVTLSSTTASQPLMIMADRRAMKQIAVNLLSNAVKFTPAHGTVTANLGVADGRLELVVADTGVGIAPEDLPRLGRPFEQVGGVEQRVQGTGLGLALARSLAELHGGDLTLESTLGEGTAVTVRLPVLVKGRSDIPPGGAEIIRLNAANDVLS